MDRLGDRRFLRDPAVLQKDPKTGRRTIMKKGPFPKNPFFRDFRGKGPMTLFVDAARRGILPPGAGIWFL